MSHEVRWEASQHLRNHQALSRQEAKSRLQMLTPGTEEYCRLQDALIRTAGIVEISLSSTSYRIDTFSDNCVLPGGFGSSEHVAIGKAVQLKGLPENAPLLVKGVIPIRFQHIVALAGDFYGVVNEAISLPGGTDQDKTRRFEKAFNTLAQADNDEVRRILLEIEQECTAVENSSLPHHCYSSHMIEKNIAIKKIKDDIDELLIDNSDHFSTHAEDAYRIGHALAMRVAREAGGRNDAEGLKRAYALDAFACHFLTDLFAAGHIRNQRGQLESFLISQLGFSEREAKPFAGILTGAQHEKDGNEGLNVSNQRGDRWRAYGDGHYFAPKNAENREKVIAATQASVDEVYAAYRNPGSSEPSTVDQLIPHPTPFNPLPIYLIEGTSLFLHRGSNKIEIKSKSDYFSKGILQEALRYLPQEYIDGFITPFHIANLPVVDKLIIPQVERITSPIWHMIGLATYYQIRQQNQQLNAKIDEMAGTITAIYNNTVEILKQLQDVNSQLYQLSWANLSRDIDTSIGTIKNRIHEYQSYTALTEDQLQGIETDLWNAHNRMSSIFCEGTADNTNILVAYETWFKKGNPSLNLSEVKIAMTLWFRQMLDYQVQAFRLNATSRVMRQGYQENLIRQQVLDFESRIIRQIEINKDHIDVTLIYMSQSYINLQLEKSETKRLAFSNLNAND